MMERSMARMADFISTIAAVRFEPAALATPKESIDHTGPYTLVCVGQRMSPYQPSSQNRTGCTT